MLRWVVGFMVAASAGHASAALDVRPAPAWVTTLALPDDAAATAIRADSGLRYLLLDHQVSLLDRSPVQYRRFAYDVTSETGLSEAGRLEITFQPDYEEVVLHSVAIVRKGVARQRAGRLAFERLRRETELDEGIVDGEETWHATLPDVRVGDRIELAYSVIGANPVFGGKYHDEFSASYGSALGARRVRLLHPQARSVRHRLSHPLYRASRHVGAGIVDSAWEASALPAVKLEPDLPPWFDAFGSIEFSEAGNWEEVAAWAQPLFARRLEQGPATREIVQRLGLSASDTPGSVMRALAFVQGEIRYTGIEIGENSHAPKFPGTTLEQRYGDCKDKTLLLIALLAEIGVEVEPVLVHTGRERGVVDGLPRATAFNHVIARVLDVPGWSFVDPTRDREHGAADARAQQPYGFGLRAVAGADPMIAIPDAPPTRPEVTVEQSARLSLDDASKGRAGMGVATLYRRAHVTGVRAEFAVGDAAQVGERYLGYMRDFYTDIEQVGAPKFLDRPDEGYARVDETYQVSWDETDPDESLSLFLFQLSDWTRLPKETRRAQPMRLGGPRWARQTIRAHSAGGWGIEPESEVVDNAHFRFERTIAIDGEELEVAADWRLKLDSVAPADYVRFRKDIAAVRDLLDFPVRVGGQHVEPVPLAARDVLWPIGATMLVVAFFGWAWLFRARNAFAGMVFQPRRTAASLIASDAGMQVSGLLIVLTAMLDACFALGVDLPASLNDLGVGKGIGYTVRAIVSSLIAVALVRLGFRMLRTDVEYSNLLRIAGWALIPVLVGTAGALIAIRGSVSWFDTETTPIGQVPGLVAAFLFIMGGLAWTIVATARGYASAASSGVGRAVGAMILGPAVILLPLVGIGVAIAVWGSNG